MTALKIFGVFLLFCLLIGFLRLGAVVTFDDALRVHLRVGALRMTFYPRRKKRNKEEKQPESKSDDTEKKKKSSKAGKKRSLPRLTPDEWIDLADTAFEALGTTVRRTCKRVRLDPLEMTVVFGGWDPAQAAMLYGTANALMYAVMPRAEETFDIPDPSLHLRLNYDQDGLKASGTLGASLRVCDLFAIAFTLLIPMAKWFLCFRISHRHDTAKQHIEIKEQQSA